MTPDKFIEAHGDDPSAPTWRQPASAGAQA